jgi:hypothetical protein
MNLNKTNQEIRVDTLCVIRFLSELFETEVTTSYVSKQPANLANQTETAPFKLHLIAYIILYYIILFYIILHTKGSRGTVTITLDLRIRRICLASVITRVPCPPRKNPRYSLNRNQGDPQSWFGRLSKYIIYIHNRTWCVCIYIYIYIYIYTYTYGNAIHSITGLDRP